MLNKTCTTAAEEKNYINIVKVELCRKSSVVVFFSIIERRIIQPGLGLREDVLVDVDHQVAAWQILHDEAHVVAGLEAAVEVDQEGMSGGVDHLEDSLLAHEAAEEESNC